MTSEPMSLANHPLSRQRVSSNPIIVASLPPCSGAGRSTREPVLPGGISGCSMRTPAGHAAWSGGVRRPGQPSRLSNPCTSVWPAPGATHRNCVFAYRARASRVNRIRQVQKPGMGDAV